MPCMINFFIMKFTLREVELGDLFVFYLNFLLEQKVYIHTFRLILVMVGDFELWIELMQTVD